jgi:hypothetical protein
MVADSWAAVKAWQTTCGMVLAAGVHLRQFPESPQKLPGGHPMRLHLILNKIRLSRGEVRLCRSILVASFACAALLFASQCAAQLRFGRDIAGPAQDAAPATAQTSPTPATPAEKEVSAPVPNVETASLVSSATDPLLSIAQDGGQSSSSQSSPSTAAPAKPPVAKAKSSHHGLGIALAVVGTAALVSGIALFATEQSIGYCSPSSHGCSEAKDAGLVLMPVGAGVAITGFYLQFHR